MLFNRNSHLLMSSKMGNKMCFLFLIICSYFTVMAIARPQRVGECRKIYIPLCIFIQIFIWLKVHHAAQMRSSPTAAPLARPNVVIILCWVQFARHNASSAVSAISAICWTMPADVCEEANVNINLFLLSTITYGAIFKAVFGQEILMFYNFF